MMFAFVTTIACTPLPTGLKPLPAGGRHILFVGNSLTYVNDLPSILVAIAQSANDTVRVMTAAAPNLALIDHLTGGSQAAAAIKLGGWDYVILQQGPTPAGICRDSLVIWTQMFDTLVKAVGGKTALFMTWPSTTTSTTFDDSRISYEDATIAVGGTFLPAAEAWRAAWEVNATLPLYGEDGFHPSSLGSYLAALEIYERISGTDARALPKGVVLAAPDSIFTQLQNAAHTANQRYPALPTRAITPKSSGTIPGGRC